MLRRLRFAAAALALTSVAIAAAPTPSGAESYQRISGEGSSWAANAIDAMRVNVKQFGITVDYNPSGSSAGRKNWLNGTVDFAASDIPFQFQPEDGSAPENPAAGSYAYIPVTAGGTSFMYNLKINGQRVTNLRLSGENVAKIFTATIKKWNDPAIVADNPGLTMPERPIVPVVRSDGSGSSAQFSRWLVHQHGSTWRDYCERSGRAPACGPTSQYPTVQGMIAQSGDLGVAGYVQQNFAEGAIGYVNYSYAIEAGFPVAKVLNKAGYYTEPTPENVAVSLLKARINTSEGSPDYLTQILDDVYTDTDPRSYQLSSYSYFILRTKTTPNFNEEKGKTLGAFAYYAMCQAQQQSASLGYSPLPINLVDASLDQIRKIPGVIVQDVNIKSCKNPTFSEDGHNVLAEKAPQPQECDKKSASQCADGTGGAKKIKTPVKPAASGGTSSSGGSSSGASSTRSASSANRSSTGGSSPSASSGGDTAFGGDGALLTSGDDSSTSVSNAEEPVASPVVLAGKSGWSGAQNLIVLVGFLVLALILAPPLLWSRLNSRRARPGEVS